MAGMRFASTGSLIALALLIALPVGADEVVLDATDQGWYAKDLGVNFGDGVHTASNENTLTGRATNDRDLRSFFVFDLTAEAEPVIAAELRLELENYSSGSASESFGVFDVSASASELNTDYGDDDPDGLAIYDDLGSGEVYASKTVAPVDVGSVIAIPLSAQAVSDLNASLGTDFAVGLDLDSSNDGGGVVEFIRFSLNDEPGIQQLVLTRAAPVPVASASGVAMLAALLAIGAVGWIQNRGRARSSL